MKTTVPAPYLSVDLDILDHNIDVICKYQNISVDRIIAVVKDSGYGIGSLQMAKSYEKKGVEYFAVATMVEALFLRENDISGTILHMGLSTVEDAEIAIKNDITLTIVDPLQLQEFSQCHLLPEFHIIIDTGMNRNGLRSNELIEGRFDSELRNILPKVTGVYTHYHSSDQVDQTQTVEQNERFIESKQYLQALGLSEVMYHSCNSGAIIYGKIPKGEHVRPGIMLHGIIPDCSSKDIGLREVSALYSCITSIREVHKGEGVGYSHLYNSETEGTIVTIPLGYGDGFSRALTQKCEVLIREKRYPILARVTMDYLLVDVGFDYVEIGDRVTLIGRDGDDEITVSDLSRALNTIPYEILCQVGASMAHHYHRSGTTVELSPQRVF